MFFERLRGLLGTLRFRLTVWNAAALLIVVLATLFGVREGLRYTGLREVDQLLDEDALEIVLAMNDPSTKLTQLHEELDRKALSHSHRGWFAQMLDAQSKPIWSSVNTPSAVFTQQETHATIVIDGEQFRMLIRDHVAAGRPAVRMRVGTSLKFLNEGISKLTQMIVLAGGIILVVAPLGGYWLAGRATEPIARIIQTAARLRPHQMDERLPYRQTGDELDQLAVTINGLLDRIAAYLVQKRDFIANAAHELRSPVTAIQSSAEVALHHDRGVEEYKDLLGDIVEECRFLGVLVNQLLLLAQSDADILNVERSRVRLDRIVERSLDMFRGVAESRGIDLQTVHLAPVVVFGDAHHLRQVVNNLIDNAIKFTGRNGQVRVELLVDRTSHQAQLRVADSGSGIEPEDLPHIFDRFYRADKSRQRESNTWGTGLGLSVCEAIVTAHGGRIDVESRPAHGSTFTVLFPAVLEMMETETPAHEPLRHA